MLEHGTHTKYVMDRCRCDPCRAANTLAGSSYRRRRALARWGVAPPPTVEASVAREHVRTLMAAGMGLRRISAQSGVSSGTVARLLYGSPSTSVAPSVRITSATHLALLAVHVDIADGRYIDGTSTRRRLQALMTVGWSGAELMAELGYERSRYGLLLTQRVVTVRTARMVRELYERWWDTAPPTVTRAQRAAVTRAKHLAAARGYAPPMAWDDDTIDNPASRPHGVIGVVA